MYIIDWPGLETKPGTYLYKAATQQVLVRNSKLTFYWKSLNRPLDLFFLTSEVISSSNLYYSTYTEHINTTYIYTQKIYILCMYINCRQSLFASALCRNTQNVKCYNTKPCQCYHTTKPEVIPSASKMTLHCLYKTITFSQLSASRKQIYRTEVPSQVKPCNFISVSTPT